MSSCKSDPFSKLGEKLSDSEMEQLMKALSEQCPVSYEIGTATGFSCEGKKVVMNYTIDEDVLSFEKMDKKYHTEDVSRIMDLLAFRVVTETVTDCYMIL
jgi:hypothetical protein